MHLNSRRISCVAGCLVAMVGVNGAHAVCSAPANQLPNPAVVLGGRTVCVGAPGNWSNQEFHSGTNAGSIIDWKRGPGNATDPTSAIGTWLVSGPSVTYSYQAGGTFTFSVWLQSDGSLDFCTGSTPAVSGAKVLSGQVPCS